MPSFPKPRTRSKYGAKRTHYGGATYHSALEARFAAQLDALRKAKDPKERVVEVKRQVPVDLWVEGKKITRYYVDFWVRYASGRETWWEVKGMDTDVWIIKRRLFEALYPKRDYQVIRKVA